MVLWYVVEKFHRVGDAFGFGFIGEDPIAAVMFHCWAKVPSLSAMWVPLFALLWFFVEDYVCARWCHGSFIEIEGAFEHVVC